jgi:hypothetical protein
MAVGLLLPMSMFGGFQFYLDAESLKPSSDYLLHVVVWHYGCWVLLPMSMGVSRMARGGNGSRPKCFFTKW